MSFLLLYIYFGIGRGSMKKFIISSLINAIKNNDSYSDEQLEVIAYGLESIYILITKLVIMTLMAILFNIVKEFLLFLLIYNFIRMPSFGLHATKSWICLLSSTIIFIGAPVIAIVSTIPIYIKVIIGIICTYLMYKNAPADTYKRPIINPKRRLVYKWISVSTCMIMIATSIICTNQFYSNAFLLAPVVQCFMISPTIYKLFKLPYNNYLNYQKNGASI